MVEIRTRLALLLLVVIIFSSIMTTLAFVNLEKIYQEREEKFEVTNEPSSGSVSVELQNKNQQEVDDSHPGDVRIKIDGGLEDVK